jgi:hypothetical protein
LGCFVNLPIALDEIYLNSSAVGKGSDLLGALVLSHHNGAMRKGFDKDHHLVGSHPKVIGNFFVIKCFPSLLIDA